MKVFIHPQPNQYPKEGGVRTHLIGLGKALRNLSEVELVDYHPDADLFLVESSWEVPLHQLRNKPMVYVCHGGFVPPISSVQRNLAQADFIISVAQWIVDKYFPKLQHKTAVIPNGIHLEEFEQLPEIDIKAFNGSGYILYGKHYPWYMDDLFEFARLCPDKKFLTVAPPPNGDSLPPNVYYIGKQSPVRIKAIMKQADALLMTGSEVNPIMLLEAWACRTPVIAKGIDGNEEVMRTAGNPVSPVLGGVLYDNPDRQKVDWVADRKDKLSSEGRAVVERRYQWPELVKMYKTVFERVLDKEMANG
jgi:glycosyltransferase involved in cell wall biosynthesis